MVVATQALYETETVVMTKTVIEPPPSDLNGKSKALAYFAQRYEGEFNGGPVGTIVYPVYDKLVGSDKKVVAGMNCEIYWSSFFKDSLASNIRGITVVLDNSCDQSFTFRLDGPNAEFVSEGDTHDTSYDHRDLVVASELGSFLQVDNDKDHEAYPGTCEYGLRIYPTKDFEDGFITDEPIKQSFLLLAIFLVTCFTFLAYDFLVKRRQKVLMNTAVKSSAIVSSLFPEVVRDRLYADSDDNQQLPPEQAKSSSAAIKNELSGFLHAQQAKGVEGVANGATSSKLDSSKPIADVYEDCTVFFCDIAGTLLPFTLRGANSHCRFVLCIGLYRD